MGGPCFGCAAKQRKKRRLGQSLLFFATLHDTIVRDIAHIRRTMMAQKKQAKKTGKGEHRKSSEYLRKGPKKK